MFVMLFVFVISLWSEMRKDLDGGRFVLNIICTDILACRIICIVSRIFSYHHYHSKAWELLLCIRGEASVQFGGGSGPIVTVSTGDLVLIPPGLAHKQLIEKNGFALLGSYPTVCFDGSIDTLTGFPTETEVERISRCHVPEQDPIFHLDIHELCEAP